MVSNVLRYELPHEYFRDVIGRRSAWIEETLGAPLSETFWVEMDFPFDRLFVHHAIPGAEPRIRPEQRLAADGIVEKWEAPRGEACILEADAEIQVGSDPEKRISWTLRWGQTPVAVWLRGVARPVIFVRLHHVDYTREIVRERTNLMIARPEEVQSALSALSSYTAKAHRKKTICVLNGPDQVLSSTSDWDDLILDPKVTSLVRSDFESFLDRRPWFEENSIPYRRGYLLHGPPGNGKTSVVRVMASDKRLSAATLNWGDSDASDSSLSNLFTWAADHAPCLVIMEDLDRHFSNGGSHERKHDISMAHLLNCLDGISSGEGVIVVATANNPQQLDPAILRRPGRFDRVVEFKQPSSTLRAHYIRKQLRGNCAEEALERMVRHSAGFSFAQLRESYILAGQMSYENGGPVTAREMGEAIELMAPQSGRPVNQAFARRSVGFEMDKQRCKAGD